MVIPVEREGRTEDDLNLSRDAANAGDVNTRKGGLVKKPLPQKVQNCIHICSMMCSISRVIHWPLGNLNDIFEK